MGPRVRGSSTFHSSDAYTNWILPTVVFLHGTVQLVDRDERDKAVISSNFSPQVGLVADQIPKTEVSSIPRNTRCFLTHSVITYSLLT